MTLLTDALRRIADEDTPPVCAVDPLSDDERALTERIVRAAAGELWVERRSVVELPTKIEESVEEPFEEPQVASRLRSELTEAFGVQRRRIPRPHRFAPDKLTLADFDDADSDETDLEQKSETALELPVAEPPPAEPPPADSPAAAVCRQILEQFDGAVASRVIAFVQVDGEHDVDACRLNDLLADTAAGLGDVGAGDVLVINPATPAESTSPAAREFATPSVRTGVRNVIHHPVALADLIAETDNLAIRTLAGRAPLGQSDETLAQIVSFVDSCRRDHAWTLVAAAASDLDDLGAFLARCDGVLVVVETGRTERRRARQAVHQLRRLGARVCGGVMLERENNFRAAA